MVYKLSWCEKLKNDYHYSILPHNSEKDDTKDESMKSGTQYWKRT